MKYHMTRPRIFIEGENRFSVNIYLHKDSVEKLGRLSRSLKVSRSEVVRKLISEFEESKYEEVHDGTVGL